MWVQIKFETQSSCKLLGIQEQHLSAYYATLFTTPFQQRRPRDLGMKTSVCVINVP